MRRLRYTVLGLALLLGNAAAPARADEKAPETAPLVVHEIGMFACETQTQAERYVRLVEMFGFSSRGDAAGKINAEEGKQACSRVRFRYNGNPLVSTPRTSMVEWRIVQFNVVAYMTPQGWKVEGKPLTWYAVHRMPGWKT